MTFAGHCFRSRFSAPQPVKNFILWRYKGKVSRGALIRKTHSKLLCEDRGLSHLINDIDASTIDLRSEMNETEIRHRKIYKR